MASVELHSAPPGKSTLQLFLMPRYSGNQIFLQPQLWRIANPVLFF